MKKLLSDIFARSHLTESIRAPSTRAALDDVVSNESHSTYGGYLLPSLTHSEPLPADQEKMESIDAVLRGVAEHVKAVVTDISEAGEFEQDLRDLRDFVNGAVTKQSDMLSVEVLNHFFSCPRGLALCEQTAFPSLVLDFAAKVRVLAVKEELGSMVKLNQAKKPDELAGASAQSVEWGLFNGIISSLELLMKCVVAIASNETLMEKFRCEVPHIIVLTAEEYPLTAIFVRDYCRRALMAVPEVNFNARLTWYLLDCDTIAQTIERIELYALATPSTLDTAEQALQSYTRSTSNRHPQADRVIPIDDLAAAAAVSEALGLTRGNSNASDREDSQSPMTFLNLPAGCTSCSNFERIPPALSETICLPFYDVQCGLSILVYVLKKTNRFTTALMEAFQTAGGYTLLSRLLDTCREEDIPALLDTLALLMPLGSCSSGSDSGEPNMLSLGARNVYAFSTMKNLLLKHINDLPETASKSFCSTHLRNEHLILQLLTRILQIYTDDYDNFVILEPRTQTLALLLSKLPYTSFYGAQVMILRIVEYVCCAAQPNDPLAHKILSIVCGLLIAYDPLGYHTINEETKGTSNVLPPSVISLSTMLKAFEVGRIPKLSTSMCELLIKILRNSEADDYKQEVSAFGLMDRGVYVWMNQIAICLKAIPESDTSTTLTVLKPHLNMYGNLLCLMLCHNSQESARFRQAQAHRSLYIIVEVIVSSDALNTPFDVVKEGRSHLNEFVIISVFTELATTLRGTSSRHKRANQLILLQSGVESDIGAILNLLKRFHGFARQQLLLLYILMDLLTAGGAAVVDLWKACRGYENLISLFASENLLENSESQELVFQMMNVVLELIHVSLDLQHGENENVGYFRSINGYSTIARCILKSGCIQTSKKDVILQRIFDLISSSTSHAEILNGDAVYILFQLLPSLSERVAISIMTKLISMLECASDTCFTSKKERAIRLVQAGAFEWMNDAEIIDKMKHANDLNRYFLKWITTIVMEQDMSIPDLHHVFRLVGDSMPKLLYNQHIFTDMEVILGEETPETGLLLLQNLLKGPVVRHISVGKPQEAKQTGRYVHIVNSTDRVWPPSSGYSFSCWLRFSASRAYDTMESLTLEKKARATTPSYSLCEGDISLVSEDNHEERMNVYGVLVGTTLKLFASNQFAIDNEASIGKFDVTNATQTGPLEWAFVSDSRAFRVSCANSASMKRWWRAVEQCHSATINQRVLNDDADFNNALFRSFGVASSAETSSTHKAMENTTSEIEEGSACIVSIYSLEASGSYTRAFFEHSTGCLRFQTGAVNSGPSMNSNTKRASVVFDEIAIDDLRPAATPRSINKSATDNDVNSSEVEGTERMQDWHQLTFTHRKAVMGSSLTTVYIDGREVATKKLNFPSAPSAGCFQAFIGSDAQVCSPHSALSWKIGPAWFTDEVISSRTVGGMFLLGPTFSYHFSGLSYRVVGDWVEARASSHLARAADRGIEIAQLAQRFHLIKLGRSCRRHWRDWNDFTAIAANVTPITANDAVAAGAAFLAESMISKKEELAEGLRLAAGGSGGAFRKEQIKVPAFRTFIRDECAMSAFGAEFESLLQTCKFSKDSVLFTVNTSSSDRSCSPILSHTQVHYVNCDLFNGFDFARSLPSLGGLGQVIFPLLEHANRHCDFHLVFKLLVKVLRQNPSCLVECIESNGYNFIASLLCKRANVVDEKVLMCAVRLAVGGRLVPYAMTSSDETTKPSKLAHPVVVNSMALAHVLLNVELRKFLPHHLQCQLVSLLMDLVVIANPNALFNARQLRRAGLLQWLLMYLTELGNEPCEMDQATGLEMKWCFPKFSEPMLEAILQYALSLLRAFVRMESHVDDFQSIGEMLLLSMTNNDLHRRESPIRIILLQFILHEIEYDAARTEGSGDLDAKLHSSQQRLSDAMVEAILYRKVKAPSAKKRDENCFDNCHSLASGSPRVESATKFGIDVSSSYPVNGLANVLLDVIGQGREEEAWASTEALLSLRILFSLAQSFSAFAEHLLCQTLLTQKIKRVLQRYSTDCSMYIPLLAYVFNIPIGDTSYNDPGSLSATGLGLTPSNPGANTFADNVWELVGEQLLVNCRLNYSTIATEVSVIVLEIFVSQVKTSLSFFDSVCKSSGTIFRILAQCIFTCLDTSRITSDSKSNPCQSDMNDQNSIKSAVQGPSTSTLPNPPCNTLEKLAKRMGIERSISMSIMDACVNLTQVIMTRALSGDEFGSLMVLFLEVLDETALKQGNLGLSRVVGQKCWLALLNYVIETQILPSTNTTLVFVKNLSTACIALARYLADEQNHNVKESNTKCLASDSEEVGASTFNTFEIDPQDPDLNTAACFGVDVVEFFLSCCSLCSQPTITKTLGVEQSRFFYGVLIYCAQTVMLTELNHARGRNMSFSLQLLNCLVESKHILLQQPNWQGVVYCGIKSQSTASDAISGIEPYHASSGRPHHFMQRVRSLSANAYKEFCIGAESDRCFIFALLYHLDRMLMDNSARVCHSAIIMWQVLIDQRFDVLKELLIVEPRTSVLQTITSTKRDSTIDLFHGGFDRLLYALHVPDDAHQSDQDDSSCLLLNKEIWSQFQHWVAESSDLLDEVLTVKSEAINRQQLDILSSCIGIRKALAGTCEKELSLDLNFPLRLGIKKYVLRDDVYNSIESDRRESVAKKTALNYTSIRDSALESMNDGFLLQRELSLRLANTRNIWQTGKWQVGAATIDITTEVEPLRSIFQRKSLGYSLDPTEGPKRMRLRLVKDYAYEARIEAYKSQGEKKKPTYAEESPWPLTLPSLTVADDKLFRRSMEFHDAVKVFKEATAAQTAEGNVRSLRVILARHRMESSRQLFDDLHESDLDANKVSILQIARRLYSLFLDHNDGKFRLGVSSSTITNIDHAIRHSAEVSQGESISVTLFDAADAEATQSAFCALRHKSFRAINVDSVEHDESDGDLGLEGTDSDDSDGLELTKQPITSKHSLSKCQATRPADASDSYSIDKLPLEPTYLKTDHRKRVDTSSDAVYGAITRFLQKEDYPPMRSFNAAYVVGMGRTPGLFMICHLGIYFVSGYTKVYTNLEAPNESNKPSFEMMPHSCGENSQSDIAISRSSSKKKKTKRLIQAALTDLGMQFAPSSKGGHQVFTIVPLPDMTVRTDDFLAGLAARATSSRWGIKYSNIKQFCRIKYQLRPVGIEFFDTFGSTYFLQFDTSTDREEVVRLLFQMPLVNSIFWSPVLRTGALAPSIKRIRQAVTKRWLCGSMTNFEYLMHLNTVAGRSFNDITQYPVFPWVIADYTSDYLDLDACDTYRNLSKPMGAISSNRAAQFCERFAALSQEIDTHGPMETPAFHYGTHYSCSAYVINYLIRLEPFTTMALELQGGNFDHPDRLFRSIPSSWTSASRDNLQDVRELIPEFFYLPEFLYNANNCVFGTTQSGEDVRHVILPPWAHNDPREFVRLNRRALESKHVSEHLHDWIDLVFGAKQTGQAAADAQNVFMHFTYEGVVDIEQITDPIMRAATLAQIENFGQTPSRLFSSPHPKRKVPVLDPTSSTIIEAASTLINPSSGHLNDGMPLSTIEAYVKWHTPLAPALVAIGKEYVCMKKHSRLSMFVTGWAIGDVKLVNDKMQCLSVGCSFMPPRCAKYLEWGRHSGIIKLRVYQHSPGTSRYREASKVLAVIEGAHHDGINCASVSEDGALLVTGGYDAVVNLIECSKTSDGRRVFKQVAKFVGHSDAVTCVAINKEFNLIASSSADRSVLLWDLRTRALLQELAGHATTICHVSINRANGNVLSATSSEIRLWSINGDLLAASSSSAFGLQDTSCAISTRCDSWQSGVIAVTGHSNGAIALWGIRYPVDLAQQTKENMKSEAIAAKNAESPPDPERICSSPSNYKRDLPVSISKEQKWSSAYAQVVPSCQLFILKLLLDHRSKVTALTLGPEQRQLFSGDAEGNCIRWVDDSVSPNIHY